jgi:hypothetical protein
MRVRRGTLAGHKRGGLWYVLLPDDHDLLHLPARPAAPPARRAPAPGEQRAGEQAAPRAAAHADQGAQGAHADLVARLDAEIAFLRAAVVQEQVANAELRRLLAAEQQRLLSSPTDTTAQPVTPAPETAENPPVPAAPTPKPARRLWAIWRR